MKGTLYKTKAGNGFKIAIDDQWLCVSKQRLLQVIDGETRSCQFRTMDKSDSSFDEFESPIEGEGFSSSSSAKEAFNLA